MSNTITPEDIMKKLELSDERLEARIASVESMILRERDWKKLPALNSILDKLLTEQVARDMEKQAQ